VGSGLRVQKGATKGEQDHGETGETGKGREPQGATTGSVWTEKNEVSGKKGTMGRAESTFEGEGKSTSKEEA